MQSCIDNFMEDGKTFWDKYFTVEINGRSSQVLATIDETSSSKAPHTTTRGNTVLEMEQVDLQQIKVVKDDKWANPLKAHVHENGNAVIVIRNGDTIVTDEDGIVCTVPVNYNPPRKDYSCLTISIYSAIVVGLVCIFLVVGRDYIKYVLLSLEKSNLWISLLVFSLLYTAVSFPMTWGYVLLNVACGYLYGLLMGIVIVMVCALVGLAAAHLIIKRFFQDFVFERLANDSVRSIIRVVDSKHGFKVIVLARFTPIPFGLQNALFAMSQMSLRRYLAASLTGMIPTQGLQTYFGSTLRSMEEVISTSSGSSTAYLVFGIQLLIVGALLIFVVRKAKLEFNKTVEEADSTSLTTIPDDKTCSIKVEPTHVSTNTRGV